MSVDLEISADLCAARLAGIVALFDAVAPGASVLFYAAGTRPAGGGAPTTSHLVTVPLNTPSGTVGEPPTWLTLDPAPLAVLALSTSPALEGVVAESGAIGWCRIVDGAGAEHLRCNVGLVGSGALVQVDKLEVYTGGVVRILRAALY